MTSPEAGSIVPRGRQHLIFVGVSFALASHRRSRSSPASHPRSLSPASLSHMVADVGDRVGSNNWRLLDGGAAVKSAQESRGDAFRANRRLVVDAEAGPNTARALRLEL